MYKFLLFFILIVILYKIYSIPYIKYKLIVINNLFYNDIGHIITEKSIKFSNNKIEDERIIYNLKIPNSSHLNYDHFKIIFKILNFDEKYLPKNFNYKSITEIIIGQNKNNNSNKIYFCCCQECCLNYPTKKHNPVIYGYEIINNIYYKRIYKSKKLKFKKIKKKFPNNNIDLIKKFIHPKSNEMWEKKDYFTNKINSFHIKMHNNININDLIKIINNIIPKYSYKYIYNKFKYNNYFVNIIALTLNKNNNIELTIYFEE
jgi:hypothetical protein